MQFWQNKKTLHTQESYRRMVFNDTSSPIKELIYVTTRRPLRPVTGRKFVTTRYLWCRSTCFFCNSSTMMSSTSSRQRAFFMLWEEFHYLTQLEGWRIDKVPAKRPAIHGEQRSDAPFPTIYQRFLWFWVRADRLLKTSTRRSSKHSVPEAEMEESILEKEPIDVVFKYIDLSDPNLIREGILQIKKRRRQRRAALRTTHCARCSRTCRGCAAFSSSCQTNGSDSSSHRRRERRK